MSKQSNLGPIDPQIGGLASQAILQEFEDAEKDINSNPNNALLWQTIIGKYHPTLLLSCKQAIEWSEKIVSEWLYYNMCNQDPNKVDNIIKIFLAKNVFRQDLTLPILKIIKSYKIQFLQLIVPICTSS